MCVCVWWVDLGRDGCSERMVQARAGALCCSTSTLLHCGLGYKSFKGGLVTAGLG